MEKRACRIGKIKIPTDSIFDNHNAIAGVLSELGLAPISIEHLDSDKVTEITGISDKFSIVMLGDIVPEYKLITDLFGEFAGVYLINV